MNDALGGELNDRALTLKTVFVILWRGVAAISLGVATGIVIQSAGFTATMILTTGAVLGVFSYRRIQANFALCLAATSVMFWLAFELEKLGELLKSI